MVTKYVVNQTLGLGNVFSPSRKEWVTAALAGGSLALGLGTSIFGGAKSSSAAKDAAARQREEEDNERAWYKRRYNENYLDTAAGQNLVNRAKEYAREHVKRAAGAQAVAGGTEASVAAAKEQANKMVADTIANISASDQARKDNIDNLHQQSQQKFAQMDMQREMGRAQNITQAAQGASNALISAAGALGSAQSLKGGNNGGVSSGVNGGSAVEEMVKRNMGLLGV